MLTARAARAALRTHARSDKARILRGFFKTGPGQYGQGDRFLGVVVPDTRRVARAFSELPDGALVDLLASRFHEERLLALLILVRQFERGTEARRRAIFNLYTKHRRHVNNWDLVDSSARQIVGAWLIDKDRALIDRLAASRRLWDRRIAIVATHAFIVSGDLKDTFRLAARLLDDREDLMHKATGWMLREAGIRDVTRLREFLRQYAARMPRTMLRYAIEKLSPRERRAWMTM